MWCSKILVAYDGSAPSKKALELACSIASQDRSIELVMVHVLKLYPSMVIAGLENLLVDEANTMREALESFADTIPNRTHVRLLKGSSPADLLLNCAHDEGCDLIVMGSRGKGGVKGYLGSISYAVVQQSPLTVLITKETHETGAEG